MTDKSGLPKSKNPWSGAPGPKGSPLNKVKFTEAKVYAFQDLADDAGMGKGVGKKIGILMGEGKPQAQAVATALSMERAGRLTPAGGYMRKPKMSKY